MPAYCTGFGAASTENKEGFNTRMLSVHVKDNESIEVAIRRFKRLCEKEGIIAEVRRRRFFEKPTTERKRKAAVAVKRHQKKLSKDSMTFTRYY